MIDRLASLNLLKNVVFLVPSILRNYQGNRLADGFLGRVAEQALGARVPTGDCAIEILADDRVVRRVHNSSEETGGALTLFDFSSGNLRMGDFDCVNQDSFDFFFKIAQGLVNEVEI